MNYFIYARSDQSGWGGDIGIVNMLKDGLIKIGRTVTTGSNIYEAINHDKIILTNTCLDRRSEVIEILNNKRNYYCINFHEDYLKYYNTCTGFYKYSSTQLLSDGDFNLNYLRENPSVVEYFGNNAPMSSVINKDVLRLANLNFPSSHMENKTILRDSKDAKCFINLFPTNYFNHNEENNDIFNVYNIPRGYILQVGRLETRKNQIASILACRNIPTPLLFISTKSNQEWYVDSFIKIIKKYRKYPTYIISENMDEYDDKSLKIIRMKDGKKLPLPVLKSAYQNAIVNLHPAFYELPGLTYIEALSCGTKNVFSLWTSIADYIIEDDLSKCEFVNPGNIDEIEKAVMRLLIENQGNSIALKEVTDINYASNIDLMTSYYE